MPTYADHLFSRAELASGLIHAPASTHTMGGTRLEVTWTGSFAFVSPIGTEVYAECATPADTFLIDYPHIPVSELPVVARLATARTYHERRPYSQPAHTRGGPGADIPECDAGSTPARSASCSVRTRRSETGRSHLDGTVFAVAAVGCLRAAAAIERRCGSAATCAHNHEAVELGPHCQASDGQRPHLRSPQTPGPGDAMPLASRSPP